MRREENKIKYVGNMRLKRIEIIFNFRKEVRIGFPEKIKCEEKYIAFGKCINTYHKKRSSGHFLSEIQHSSTAKFQNKMMTVSSS